MADVILHNRPEATPTDNDFVAFGTATAFVSLNGTSIQTTSLPSSKAPTVQLGVHV